MKIIKLLILQGLPASGKSTFAKKLCKDNPETWVRVCRDDIRSMLGTYWIPNRENLVNDIENSSIDNSLSRGYNVVVDATNLNKKQINNFKDTANFWDEIHEFEEGKNASKEKSIIIEFKEFKTPLWKCIWRDWKRGVLGDKKVGSKIIKEFYNRYYVKT